MVDCTIKCFIDGEQVAQARGTAEQALAEAERLAKVGGRVLVTSPASNTYEIWIAADVEEGSS